MWGPITIGDASPSHHTFTVTSDTGVVSPFSLVGLTASNLALHFQSEYSPTVRVGTGTWTITDATNGLADYAPSSTDVQAAGAYTIYPVVQLTSGPKAFKVQYLQINNLP